MATSTKRKNPFTCGYEILGMFPIQPIGYEPYLISANNQGIFPEFCIANGVTVRDEESAKQQLMERDHPAIIRLKYVPYEKGNIGTLMFPPAFLTKMPGVLNEFEFNTRRQAFIQTQGEDTEEAIPDYEQRGDWSGELTERELFFGLKSFYEQSGDDVVILHSHFFLWNDNTPEKDFIVLNLTKGMIMVIEAKQHTKQQKLEKGLKQIEDARKRIEKLFSSIDKMSSIRAPWMFVGVMYLRQGRAGRCCDNCPDFTIATYAEINKKLKSIDNLVNDENRSWVPEEHLYEFIEICKSLFFTAQGKVDAPVTQRNINKKINEEIEKTSEAKYVFFWTPNQMSIVNAMDQPFMMFLGFYGVGKTLLLKKRLNHLIKNTTDHIWFYIDKDCKGLFLSLTLEFKEFYNNRIKFWPSSSWPENQTIGDRLVWDGIDRMDGQVHVLCDEYSLRAGYAFQHFPMALDVMKQKVKSLWISIGSIDSKISEEDLVSLRSKVEEKDFVCPRFEYCLRNSRAITQFVTENKSYADPRYSTLAKELKLQNNVNAGILNVKDFDSLPKSIQWAKSLTPQKTFWVCDSHGKLKIKEYQSCIKNLLTNALNCDEEEDFKKWYNAEETEDVSMLYCTKWHPNSIADSPEVTRAYQYSGIEVTSMVYFCRVCPDCQTCLINQHILTRAKVNLVVVRYKVQCDRCQWNSTLNQVKPKARI